MTEQEWLVSNDPLKMLQGCRKVLQCHPRKGRLFAVASCHRIWHLIGDERSRAAVVVSEQFAEGLVSKTELESAQTAAQDATVGAFGENWEVRGNAEWAAFFAASLFVYHAATRACNSAFIAAGDGPKPGPEHTAQCHLLRCIFGPLPFHGVAFDESSLTWNGCTVVKIAQSIYDKGRFQDIPILADALEDAGCDNADILNHLRQPGEHVRGCWVLDAILGKE